MDVLRTFAFITVTFLTVVAVAIVITSDSHGYRGAALIIVAAGSTQIWAHLNGLVEKTPPLFVLTVLRKSRHSWILVLSGLLVLIAFGYISSLDVGGWIDWLAIGCGTAWATVSANAIRAWHRKNPDSLPSTSPES